MRRSSIFCLLLLFALLLASCKPAPVPPTPTVPPPLPTVTPVPTQTPTPMPGVVVLVAAPHIDTRQVEEDRVALEALAKGSGYLLEVRQSLQAADVKPTWKVVVLPFGLPELPAIASSALQTQFVTLSAVDIPAAANLTVIRTRPEKQAFIAGMATILAANDWRAGALLPAGQDNNKIAFLSGARYFCGRCASVYSPIVLFPVTVELPAQSAVADWLTNAEQSRVDNILYAMYVAPEAASPDLLYALASKGLALVGGQTPPDNVRPRWAVTVRYDMIPPLTTLWPDISAGKGGKTVDASLGLSDVQAELFSVGRQGMVKKAIKTLDEGLILPVAPPIQ